MHNLGILRTSDMFRITWISRIEFTQNFLWLCHLRTRGILRTLSNIYMADFYRNLCNTGIFRTQSIFGTLSNIYDGKFYSQPCVTPACLESLHIQNTAKHLSGNILFKTLCNPDIFRSLVYSELWYILKSKHIQNPAEYLRWSILLRTLCNYSRFRRPLYSKLPHIQNRCLSAAP